MKKLKIKKGYDWQYVKIGGVVRVRISRGEDIAHLGELDQKMWTAMSCPVDGLEFDRETLKMLDTDGDGKIRVPEIVAAAEWLSSVVRDRNSLLKGASEISLDNINADTPEGKVLLDAAKKVLAEQGLGNKKSISVDESSKGEATLKFYSDCKDYVEWMDSADEKVFVFGDNTAAAYAAYAALKDKVADYFMRCRLVAFNGTYAEAVDVPAEKVSSIADKNLALSSEVIAEYPLAKPSADAVLHIESANPAWRDALNALLELTGLSREDLATEESWDALASKFDAYVAWNAAKKGADVESLGLDTVRKKLEELNSEGEGDIMAVREVNRLTHYFKYFCQLLRNFVVFEDFYSLDTSQRAVFEAGELYIDQRCCRLCIKVADMAGHTDMPALSRMFLIYCHCKSKVKNAEMDIVAVMTAGTMSGLRVGRNALFYDRDGQDWDAVVTKIVQNPISVSEAFWAPYVQFGEFCSNLINKSAENKNKQVMGDMEGKAVDVSNAEDKTKVQPFDIAKFAGIFAALGMGLGLLANALVGLMKGVMALKFWQLLLLLALIMLVISGPSCFLAWRKLRKRSLGPVLNANGWVINSQVLVNVLFGSTLTSVAKYPKLKVEDPFVPQMKWWQKLLSYLIPALVVAFLALYFTNSLPSIGINLTRDKVVNAVNEGISDFNADLSNAAQAATAEMQNDSTKIQAPAQQ